MITENELQQFLVAWPSQTREKIQAARTVVLANLPGISETIDVPARLLAYSFGTAYKDMICVLIPSQKDAKLSFSKGVQLADDFPQLTGAGKLTRFVSLFDKSIDGVIIEKLLKAALNLHTNTKNQTT